ncbi:MAG: glycosyltransferase family 2 protein [Microcoleaceae cyanobacterium]
MHKHTFSINSIQIVIVKMQQPLVSVIIPTYNRIAMLQEATESVLAQDFKGKIEIIVIDDNSSDETCEVVSQKYPEVKLICLNQNQGAGAARNQGLQMAQGQYLAFLDSDDLWEKSYLREQISALEGKSKFFSISDILTSETAKNKKSIHQMKPNLRRYTSPLHHLMVGNFIHIASCVVFPHQVLQDVGLFDENIRYGQDADFYVRCLIADYKPIFINRPLAIQRKHNQSQLTDIKNQNKRITNRLYLIEKNYSLIQKKDELNVSKNKLYADVYKKYARMCLNQNNTLQWLQFSKKIAHYSSWYYALSNMINDLKSFVIGKLKFRGI